MRKGDNPIRDQRIAKTDTQHTVVIPYFISKDSYFEDTLKILEYCLSSLKSNSCYHSNVHVVANGSHSALVQQQLCDFMEQGLIDDLSIITRPIGKVNAILSVLRNVRSSYVTITDADVLFLPSWDEHVFDVFHHFPKAAAVSPVPIFRTYNRLTANIWWDYFFSSKLRFTPVKDKDSLTKYAKSIGWPWLDDKFKTSYMTLSSKKGFKAVVGNGHFCVTYNTSVFKALPYENTEFILGGDSEHKYLDQPAALCDGYRLATLSNHAYHMGNQAEPWMCELMSSFSSISKTQLPIDAAIFKLQKTSCFLKFKCFKYLLVKLKLLKWFYQQKGLLK
jgi:hypothetical protein